MLYFSFLLPHGRLPILQRINAHNHKYGLFSAISTPINRDIVIHGQKKLSTTHVRFSSKENTKTNITHVHRYKVKGQSHGR